ncbi:MAG: acyl carrier protein [Candidatus Omnitrophica bacterium]|nr:acyl carrier protein [Candidatus Omnitrophota bacterium]MCM8791341.1 acyl carrier protein [Candidatus Omnitrophota bacterium]
MTRNYLAIKDKVRAILSRQLSSRGMTLNVADTDSIIAAGILDSLSAIELVTEVEKSFGITILPEEMTEANFDSIQKIADFLSAKTSERS